ncbi:hypothetical protein [Thalassospira profundimaris]|uniref:hypothetical protein n=1 Tax=Thalassospira profundimaris TaxID=502049 RepID=UPI000DEDC2C0|nr:hypothetical protein [Thalassospira profundimaris]
MLPACEIGLDADIVFHESGYKGEGPWLSEHFQNVGNIGVPLLVFFDMTDASMPTPASGVSQDEIILFPKMRMWLRQMPDFSEQSCHHESRHES